MTTPDSQEQSVNDPYKLGIKPDAAMAFLAEASVYFMKRDTDGGDRAHWANVYNASNCDKTIALITRLTQERDRLVDALRPFAEEASKWDDAAENWPDNLGLGTTAGLTVGKLRATRTALTSIEEQG